MGQRDWYEREIDSQDPLALSSWRWRPRRGSVDVEFCGGGPLPSASGFRQGLDLHVPSAEGGEGRRLEGSIVDPRANGYRGIGGTVGTMYGRARSASIWTTSPSLLLT